LSFNDTRKQEVKLRIALLVLLVGTANLGISAQDLSGWIDVAPVEELFVVQMPTVPTVKDEKASTRPLSGFGKRYTALIDGNSYIVWSFANLSIPVKFHDSSQYLDACADLVWEGLLEPRRAKQTKVEAVYEQMIYRAELSNNGLMGREYQIVLSDAVGITRIYAQNSRIYILALLSSKAKKAMPEHFFNSFKVNQSLSVPTPSDTDSLASGGQIVGGGGGQDINGNKIFTGREVSQKVRVVSKPEPTYTESARKYSVTGTVVLRAVFSGDGQITNIRILRRLPHGLTDQALDAARKIRFLPAQKDGQPVSMTIQLEYNFNLY
jgi:TonB family protein